MWWQLYHIQLIMRTSNCIWTSVISWFFLLLLFGFLMDSSGLLFGILSNAESRKNWGYVLVQLLIHPALSAQLPLEFFFFVCLRQLWLCKKKKKCSIFVIFHIILYATHWHINEKEWTLRYQWTKCAWYVIFGPYVLSWRSTKWWRDGVYIYTSYILFYSVLVIKLYLYKSY